MYWRIYGITRIKGKYFFLEVETVSLGAIIGVIFAFSRAIFYAVNDKIIINPFSDWIILIFMGFLLGAGYGKIGEVRAKTRKQTAG